MQRAAPGPSQNAALAAAFSKTPKRSVRDTRIIMGMPVTVEIAGPAKAQDLEDVFAYFEAVDERFSTYKEHSEVMRLNRGELGEDGVSDELREVLALAEQTKEETQGYFDIMRPDGICDPSGVVKGWAIFNAAQRIRAMGYEHFYVDAGGDVQTCGKNAAGEPWSVGVRNPFDRTEVVQVLYPRGAGVATSGSYIRGPHIYDPHRPGQELTDMLSITVLGPNVLEADRFATAAFAMGKEGIYFVESVPGLEGFAIDSRGIATMTSGFNTFTAI